ncbi:Chemotaxis protein methyltransferase CheR [Euzebya pacifica]|uniref:protein-glutamate O-methyltransferase n=1 Tax=Euzebya pacifica TaxID=1608957 RepID=A0A346XSS9_9ACTN|nr:protein-glutamate O-methyltransferase CheR [Euzebya pacifica]AXV05276.1 Chemotaxis protein methyltransferase CheR [Euzebya pacifica]
MTAPSPTPTTTRRALSATDVEVIRRVVHERTGITLGDDKEYLITARLRPVVVASGLGSLGELVARLRTDPPSALVGMVVDALVINETSFFRDVHPFVGLKDHVLPDLIERRRRDRMLTIWCAAASSGQEPYTIAMILADQFPELAGWTIRLLATDVSSTMVARGRRGRFTGVEVARGLPPVLRQRHLAPAGDEWQVSPALRRAVQFEQHNLAGSWDVIPRCDIVFLRNVLIYFDPAVTRRVLLKARGRLAEDGYLALGGAETTVGTDTPFRRVTLGRSAWYRPS